MRGRRVRCGRGSAVVRTGVRPDPGHAEGGEEAKWRAFINVASQIAARADLFCAFPVEKLFDALAVRSVGEEFKL